MSVKGKLNDGQHNKFIHVTGYVVDLVNNKPQVTAPIGDRSEDETQSGCPNCIPGLIASPFWDTATFAWVSELESKYEEIKAEFISLRAKQSSMQPGVTRSGFQHYRSPVNESVRNDEQRDGLGALATTKGDWNVCYLYLHGMDFADNLALCPVTAAAIQSIPRHYHHAMFSALAPDTHVKAHYGPTNKKLRCHLPIHIPPLSVGDEAVTASTAAERGDDKKSSSWIRVAGETRFLQEGKAVIFDDSFLHEAANTSSEEPRVVLIIDVWHPDLTDEEVKFLDFVNKAQVKTAQKLSQLQRAEELEKAQAAKEALERMGADQNETESSVAGGGEDGSPIDGVMDAHNSAASSSLGSDFFSVIQRAKSAGISAEDQAAIWGQL